MIKGEVVNIRGISQKGRNRVHEHGCFWLIKDIRFDDLLLEAESDGYLKWLKPDFEVVI